MKIKLFYSYSHQDSAYQKYVETSLAMLKRDKLITEWSDKKILAGEKISQKIKEEMDETNIFLFLFSNYFIKSDACVKEWEYAKKLSENKNIFRIPIIVRVCSWQDFLKDDDVRVLPNDGTPVSQHEDEACQEIYNGVKSVVNELKKTFKVKDDFLTKLNRTGFIAEDEVTLSDIFVFPTVVQYQPNKIDELLDVDIKNHEDIFKKKYVLIHGEELCGKTSLCKHLYMSLIEKDEGTKIFIDLESINHKIPNKDLFEKLYEEQYEGDYGLWKEQGNITAIFDNLSESKNSILHVKLAMDFFSRIIVSTSSNKFKSYFKDEEKLSEFSVMEIRGLSHVQQEKLIKKRLTLSDQQEALTHEKIDAIENVINSVIINKNLLPRYPFYILSILQTYEGYMPKDMAMTSNGHCYYALILAHLIKSGIGKTDDQINPCFNFSERLAFCQYQKKIKKEKFKFDEFVKEYQAEYEIKESIINRLKSTPYGIISPDGKFKYKYIYFFFLGKFLAANSKEHKKSIENITEKSYIHSNSLILLFVIHHVNDDQIIDDILLHIMCSFDSTPPATLNKDETKILDSIIRRISKDVTSKNSVDEEREKEREGRDSIEQHDNVDDDEEHDNVDDDEEHDNVDSVNNVYRVLKNSEVLGQILKNKSGNFKRERLLEIINVIMEGGLRLIKLFLDEKEINATVSYIKKQNPNEDLDKIQELVRFIVFLWTIGNMEKIVSVLNNTDLLNLVNQVVKQKETPAYDLIYYCARLDSNEGFDHRNRDLLKNLLKKHHDNDFINRILSIRTQFYLNTHKVKTETEQSVCSLLKIQYKPRVKNQRK